MDYINRIDPRIFRSSLVVTESFAKEAAAYLISAEDMETGNYSIANGTSFAVTARENQGLRRLWLSPTSYDRLHDGGFNPAVLRQTMI